MNPHTPDGVADALRGYLTAIDQLVADHVTDDDIESRLRILKDQQHLSISTEVEYIEPVQITGESPIRPASNHHGSPTIVSRLPARINAPTKAEQLSISTGYYDIGSLATASEQLARYGAKNNEGPAGSTELARSPRKDLGSPKHVYVSYAHDSSEHKAQVLKFCVLLRKLGVDVRVDEWGADLRRDWFVWIIDQFTKADHVIVVASPHYRAAGDGASAAECHRGVQTESAILRDFLRRDRAVWTSKILPVILPGKSVSDIPLYLQPSCASSYPVPEISLPGVAELVAVLTGRPRHVRPQLGDINAGENYRESVRWSTAPVISTLPRDIAAFTGRDREVAELTGRIEVAADAGEAAIHLVDGMTGVGKTAFAVHVAHQVAVQFPDGQHFLELRGHTPGRQPVAPADALGSLLLATGVAAAHLPTGLDHRARMWRNRLTGKRMLLLLDDVADDDQVRPLLPGVTGCQVVITSRRRLAGIEDAQPLPLGELPPDQAVAMFLRLAQRPPDGDESELVRLCGHLPLAIGLTAGRLRSHPRWDVRYLTEQLMSTRDRLSEIHAGDRDIVTAFEASYRNLPPEVQRLFRRLSLHPGVDFDLAATVALGGGEVADTRRQLETLYFNHLIEESAPGRFRLHDLISHFARTRLASDLAESPGVATERLLDYYVHVARRAAALLPHHDTELAAPDGMMPSYVPRLADEAAALRWFADERINLSSCVEYSHSYGRTKQAVHLAAAMHIYLAQQGYWDDALAIHDVACRAAARAKDVRGLAVSLRNRGVVQLLLEDYSSATANLRQAHQLYAEIDDAKGLATTIQCIGEVQYSTGDYEAASDNLRTALTLCDEAGDQVGAATARYRLGIVAHLTNDCATASSHLARAYAAFTRLGNRQGEANALGYLGQVFGTVGDYPGAMRCLMHAASLFEETGDRRGVANVFCRLGNLLQIVGRYQEAVATAMRAHALFLELGSYRGQANVLTGLAMARYLRSDRAAGRQAIAIDTLEEALALCDKVGDRLCEATIYNNLGLVHRLAGHPHDATKNLIRALELREEIRAHAGEAETLNNLGELARDWPEAGDAYSRHQQALDLARKIGAQLEEARALEGIGRLLARDSHIKAGSKHLREALQLYTRLGVPEAKHLRTVLADLIDTR